MTWITDDEDFGFGYNEKHDLNIKHPRHSGDLSIRVIQRPNGKYAIKVFQEEWDLGKEPGDAQQKSLDEAKRDALIFARSLFLDTIDSLNEELERLGV